MIDRVVIKRDGGTFTVETWERKDGRGVFAGLSQAAAIELASEKFEEMSRQQSIFDDTCEQCGSAFHEIEPRIFQCPRCAPYV